MLSLALAILLSSFSAAGEFSDLAEELSQRPDLVNVGSWSSLSLDIRYSTENNFMGRDIYGEFNHCFLHQHAARQLKRSLQALSESKPGWKFLVFDCLRPRRAQWKLWEVVKGTPQQRYVANPESGSVHNYGFALDLSLADENGREVDMGTRYDFFGALAEPKYESEFLKEGKLSTRQVGNRRILREAMKAGGFHPISNEWWHFDGLPGAEVRSKYKIIE